MEYFDKFHYFKLSSFMIQVCRLKSYETYAQEKKKALEEARAKQSKDSLFATNSK